MAEDQRGGYMMASLEVPIEIKMSVDEDTANACLKIVEIYANNNHANVVCEKNPDGSLSFRYELA